MQENQNIIEQISDFISVKYPILGKVVGFSGAAILMFLGIKVPDIHNVVIKIYDIEIPKIVMQIFQAYLGLGGFMIAVATFFNNEKNKNKL